VQKVVNCVVNRGGVVVKVWLETTANLLAKKMPTFPHFFSFFCNDRRGTDTSPFTEPQTRAQVPGQWFALAANGANALQLEGDAAADAFGLVCQE